MIHLCYTLEEASEKLKLTETVLVRLSQYFKVPRGAYEASGYLSFKGDLAFTEADIEFFRQAKERLLLGESLEVIKNRVREQEQQSAQAGCSTGTGAFSEYLVDTQNAVEPKMEAPQPLADLKPLHEIQGREPYEKAAEVSFERYKSVHRTGLGRVFENMLKEVGANRSDDKNPEVSPNFRPLRPKTSQMSTQPSLQVLPFQKVEASQTSGPVANQSSRVKQSRSSSLDPSWEHLLKQAIDQPRTLNSHLKGAAALLRERATGQMNRLDPFSR
jgi:hypothetical protein